MQDIRAWLDNRDYTHGVALYEKYGASGFLKRLFAGGPDEYTRTKLLEEMKQLVADADAITVGDPLDILRQPDTKAHATIGPVYLKLCRSRDQVYRQIDRAMYRLDVSRTKATLHEIAKSILRLQRKKQRILNELEYIDEHGTPMPVLIEKEHKTPEMQRLYVQICKAEARLQKDDLRNRTKTEMLLAKKRARLEELRRERNGL